MIKINRQGVAMLVESRTDLPNEIEFEELLRRAADALNSHQSELAVRARPGRREADSPEASFISW